MSYINLLITFFLFLFYINVKFKYLCAYKYIFFKFFYSYASLLISFLVVICIDYFLYPSDFSRLFLPLCPWLCHFARLIVSLSAPFLRLQSPFTPFACRRLAFNPPFTVFSFSIQLLLADSPLCSQEFGILK